MTEFLNGLFDQRGARLLAVILCLFILINAEAAHSQTGGRYSAAEQIYLMNINPVLNDYSQTASKLNSLVVYLQTEPPEECAEGFGHYRSIFSSLKLQLISFEPPSSLEQVHRNSLEAITDYETGADLYESACVEEDLAMRNRLKIRAAEYFSASVEKIGEVYAEIETRQDPVREVEQLQTAPPEIIEPEAVVPQVTVTEVETREVTASESTSPEQPRGKYSAAEQIYLTSINPVLNDYSQTASELNSLVIYLQTEPPEECAEGFGHYRSIFSSLKLQLISFEPPSSLEQVHRNSLEAITDYETGADLYESACVEEDLAMRNRLKIRAGEYFSASVEKIGEVYAEFERPDASGTQAVEEESTVIAETGIMTENEVSEIEAPQAPAPEVKTPQTAPPENTLPEDDKTDIAVTESEKPVEARREEERYADTGIETGELDVKSEESDRREAQETQDEISKEDRIAKLNEMIMRRGTAEKEIPPVDTPASTATEAAAPDITVSGTEAQKEEITKTELLADDIESWCVTRTGNEAEREKCVTAQAEAKDKIEKLIESHPAGTRESDVAEKCKSDWKEGDTYNYEMVVSCIQFFCVRQGMGSCKELTN